MADKTVYFAYGLIGGGADDLDFIDGSVLLDQDVAFVYVSNALYIYLLDADSAAAESSPDIISPDNNAGDKRWILQTPNRIKFPATAVPSADPNTLDDYEEGTFTPTILLGGTPVTSYSYQYGYYTKIGNRMFFNLYVTVNVIGAGAGAVTIGGLPGTALASTKNDSSVSVHADYLTGLTGQHLSGIIAPSTSSVALFYLLNTRATALPHTIMDAADTVLKITGAYMSAHPT